ncbi:MAG TPA: SGNH hydrolase domain-containing protein [Baekduia sp.]
MAVAVAAALGVLAVLAGAAPTAPTLAGEAPCFGAAARDPQRTCENPKSTTAVVPTPARARQLVNAPCQVVERLGRVRVCAFGAAAAPGVRTVALIGDSHASHWRAALDVVVRRKGWRGLSVTHSSCPFSAATAMIPQPGRGVCVEWKRDVRAWLARHPEIDTVFFGQHSGGTVIAPRGSTQWGAQVEGYEKAWRALPAQIAHVLVLRDTPKMRSTTLGCVQDALARHLDPGRACAQPRSRALERDPAAVAAAHVGRRGVRTFDLTRLLCDRRSCFPVIGGALVYKDILHFTATFSTTLGPYLLRLVDALGLR